MNLAEKYRKPFFLILLFCLFALYIWSVDRNALFYGDTLEKYIQAHSVIQNNFKSSSIYYNASELDPAYKFTPATGILYHQSFISPFPEAYAYFSAVFMSIFSPEYLVFVSWILFAIILYLLYQCSHDFYISIFWIPFLTPLFFQFTSFGDFAFALFFGMAGISIFYKQLELYEVHSDSLSLWSLFSFQNKHAVVTENERETKSRVKPIKIIYIASEILSKKDTRVLVTAGFFAGVLTGSSLWFRLEGILFLAAFLAAYSIVKKLNIFNVLLIAFLAGFIAAAAVFFSYNFYSFGHILGSRYLFNEGGIFSQPVKTRIYIIQSLLFFGNMRVGFFFFMPFLLIATFYYFYPKHYKSLPAHLKILYLNFIFNTILVSLFAPNDSNIDWGSRYLGFSVLPGILVFSHFYKSILKEQFIRGRILKGMVWFTYAIAIIIHLLLVSYMHKSPSQIHKFKEEFAKLDSHPDLYLFSTRLHAQHLTTEIVKKKVMIFYEIDAGGYAYSVMQRIKKDPQIKSFVYISLVSKQTATKNTILQSIETDQTSVIETLKKEFILVEEKTGKLSKVYTFKKRMIDSIE